VDGGSTDNTAEIVNRFVVADKRFRYIHQDNLGVSSAKNTGIRNTTGEFIQFLDGDDLLQKKKVENQILAFRENPEIDIVYSDVRFFDEGKKDLLRASLPGNKPDDWLPHVSGRGEAVLKHLASINFLVTHSPLLKREVIGKAGYFDESMFALEDWDFWLRCAFQQAYFHFRDSENGLALVRVHTSSLSRKTELMRNGKFVLFRKCVMIYKTGLYYKLYFTIKHSELFWDTLVAGNKIPKIPFAVLFVSVLLLPVWLIIKTIRLIF
jgi:glycosyltransferase involved in cell wall biosynthesis